MPPAVPPPPPPPPPPPLRGHAPPPAPPPPGSDGHGCQTVARLHAHAVSSAVGSHLSRGQRGQRGKKCLYGGGANKNFNKKSKNFLYFFVPKISEDFCLLVTLFAA